MVRSTIHIITCTRGNSFGSQMIFRNFNFIGFIEDLLLFQACSNEGPCSFPTGDNSKKYMYIDNIFIFLLQNHWVNFNQTCAKHPCPHPFPRGDSDKILKSSPEPLGQFQPNLAKNIHG